MKTPPTFHPVLNHLICLPLLLSAGCTTYFHDSFNSDPIDNPPLASPAGFPTGDRLELGGNARAHRVLNSVAFASPAYQMDRGSLPSATTADCILACGPRRHGRYLITFRARAVADGADLNISAQSCDTQRIFNLRFKNGMYFLNNLATPATVPGTFNPVHKIGLVVDMDRRRTTFLMNDNILSSNQPFLEPATDFKLLQFAYAGAVLEAFPGTYQLDDITVQRIR